MSDNMSDTQALIAYEATIKIVSKTGGEASTRYVEHIGTDRNVSCPTHINDGWLAYNASRIRDTLNNTYRQSVNPLSADSEFTAESVKILAVTRIEQPT